MDGVGWFWMFLCIGGKNGGVSEYFVCFFLLGWEI